MTKPQPTAAQRRRWLARARTLLAKVQDLQSEMIAALDVSHEWTDFTDNVIVEAEALVSVIENRYNMTHIG